MRDTTNAREHILDTAERIVAQGGVKKLTIEGVATAAKLSRGGVFYHFPTKEALIAGMVTRLVDLFERSLEQAMADDPDPHGRFTRAYARLVLGMYEGATETQAVGGVMSALIAGLAYDPCLLDPLNERLQSWQRRSEAELDPSIAAIVRLTTHALWLNPTLLTNTFTIDDVRAIVARLEAMTRAAT